MVKKSDTEQTVCTVCDNERTKNIVAQIKIELELSVTENISLWDISRHVGISRYHMTHLFKKHTGMTLIEYKQKFRLDKAKRMLATSDKTISEIASECGWGSTTYFSGSFQKSEGVSPTEYRRKYRK